MSQINRDSFVRRHGKVLRHVAHELTLDAFVILTSTSWVGCVSFALSFYDSTHNNEIRHSSVAQTFLVALFGCIVLATTCVVLFAVRKSASVGLLVLFFRETTAFSYKGLVSEIARFRVVATDPGYAWLLTCITAGVSMLWI